MRLAPHTAVLSIDPFMDSHPFLWVTAGSCFPAFRALRQVPNRMAVLAKMLSRASSVTPPAFSSFPIHS
jgi:hypothetical protein